MKSQDMNCQPSPATSCSSVLLDDARGARNLIEQMNLICALKDADNKKILWLAMNTPAWKSTLELWDTQHEIFGEIENRLYPEYDGEKVTFEDWGWNTPEGEIRYLPKSSNDQAHRPRRKRALSARKPMNDQETLSVERGADSVQRPCSAFAREVCTLLADDSMQYAPMADELSKQGCSPKWAAVQIMQCIVGPDSERWRNFGRGLGFRV